MNYHSYFKFSELFDFGDDADKDDLAEEAMRATGQAFNAQVSVRDGEAESVLKQPTYQWQDQRK